MVLGKSDSPEDKLISSVVATAVCAVVIACLFYYSIKPHYEMRSRIADAKTFELYAYLLCHEMRVKSVFGNAVVDCDRMSGLNVSMVEPYIWNMDINRELLCTAHLTEYRRSRNYEKTRCWDGPLTTAQNYCDIGTPTAVRYLECLNRAPGWPMTADTNRLKFCDPIIPATYDVLLDRYKTRAGANSLAHFGAKFK